MRYVAVLMVIIAIVPTAITGQMQLNILFATAAVAMLGSLLLTMVVLFIIPGRKGRLRTTREVYVPGLTLQQLWQVLAHRMRWDGFIVDPTGPNRITASRPARHYSDAGGSATVTHATKALGVEAELMPAPAGVNLRMTLWMNDFVLLDTGEGRQIDQTLHRLIAADLDHEPPPITPGTSTGAIIGSITAGIVLAGLAVPFFWHLLRDRFLPSYAAGLAAAAGHAAFLSCKAMSDIKTHPQELTGKRLARYALLLAIICIVASNVWALLALHKTGIGTD